MDLHALERRPGEDGYLFSRGQAWFAFVMTLALMIFDYVDRQVIVSLFPYLKAEWGLSDKQLGALVSVVSITVALGALPVALFADRVSRVRSIVAMATIWSLATISCMWARSYGALVAAFSLALAPPAQFALIVLGGFLATCIVGPVAAIVIDVIDPGVRATGSSVLALFQNLFGLAAGPVLAGLLSDAFGLVPALTATPLFALVAAGAFLLAAGSYEGDKARATAASAPEPAGARPALA